MSDVVQSLKFDDADRPLVAFWQELLPGDFDFYDKRKRLSLEFELSGIDRGQSLVKLLADIGYPVDGKKVLDIGSGNGGLCIAAALSGSAQTCGVETETSRILLAKKWAECRGVHVRFEQGVAEALPFGDETFDVVFFWSVIEHVQSHEKAVREIARVLKPGGVVAINGPNRFSPQLLVSDPHYHTWGVSVLPPRLGAWWCVKVRRLSDHYGVGVFPTYSGLVRRLKRYGISVIYSTKNHYMLELLETPDKIRSALKRQLVRLLKRARLNKALALIMMNTLPIFLLIGRKRS